MRVAIIRAMIESQHSNKQCAWLWCSLGQVTASTILLSHRKRFSPPFLRKLIVEEWKEDHVHDKPTTYSWFSPPRSARRHFSVLVACCCINMHAPALAVRRLRAQMHPYCPEFGSFTCKRKRTNSGEKSSRSPNRKIDLDIVSYFCICILRVDFLLKTDSGYPKDTGVNKPWQPLRIPSAITPIGQLHQSPPSPIPGDFISRIYEQTNK